jgi:anaerobic selenocysteine-containing dehydrogenase
MTSQSGDYSRRDFMKTSATAVASLSALSLGLASRAYAAGSDRVRVGLIGCGGRGSGAASNCLEADDGVEIVAIADAFQDRIDRGLTTIRQWCEKNSKPFGQRM